jgi:hypothetical protein
VGLTNVELWLLFPLLEPGSMQMGLGDHGAERGGWAHGLAIDTSIVVDQGAGSQANMASARASTPGCAWRTRPARASEASRIPPSHTAPSAATSRTRSGSASVRAQVAPAYPASRRKRPWPPGRSGSATSSTSAPSAA